MDRFPSDGIQLMAATAIFHRYDHLNDLFSFDVFVYVQRQLLSNNEETSSLIEIDADSQGAREKEMINSTLMSSCLPPRENTAYISALSEGDYLIKVSLVRGTR